MDSMVHVHVFYGASHNISSYFSYLAIYPSHYGRISEGPLYAIQPSSLCTRCGEAGHTASDYINLSEYVHLPGGSLRVTALLGCR